MRPLAVAGLIILSSMLAGCSAGDAMYSTDPAGFFWGLWHGAISFIALIIHIFNDGVQVYEVNNTGGWYDFGFLIGVTAIWGASSKASSKSRKKKRDDDDELGKKVEAKLKRKIKKWAEED